MSDAGRRSRRSAPPADAPQAQASAGPRVATPLPLPPELGAGRLEVVASPFRIQRITLRRLLFEENPPPDRVAPPPTLADRINVDLQLRGGLNLFAEGCEVTLEVRAIPDPARMPVQVQAALSAFIERPEAMPDAEFARVMGEVGPRLVLPYARQAITQVTALGLYGPLNLDLLNVRLAWDAPLPPPAGTP